VDGSRIALIIASSDYTDPGLRRLRAPTTDAQALAEVLRDPAVGGFDVRTLLNEPAHEVNEAVEEFFADRRPDDLLLMHFSCHGVKDADGELYFATTNTRLRSLGSTAVSADFVTRRMGRSRSRRVALLLDCCYAGAFERGMTARAGSGVDIEAQFGGRGRAVITASSAMEYAFEGGDLVDTHEPRPSVFTSALVKGLRTGDADRDQDGLVSLDELYEYVFDTVRATTPNQTPGKWVLGMQGHLYIARRAVPVTVPAELPPKLHEAIDSPFATVRAAAVEELARLLHGRHAGLALAARSALERLANDDSRSVAAAAATALASPEVVPAGSASPEADTVELTLPKVVPEASVADRPAPVTPATAPAPEIPASLPTMLEPAWPTATPLDLAARRMGIPRVRMGSPWVLNRLGLLVAGTLAIVGAVLTFLALFPYYAGDSGLSDSPASLWPQVLTAALAMVAGAGVATLPYQPAAPGLLLGSASTALASGVYDIIFLAKGADRIGAGLWLDLAGSTILVLAAGVAARTVIRSGGAQLVLARLRDPLALLIALLGWAGAIALISRAQSDTHMAARGQSFVMSEDLAPLIWLTILAGSIPLIAVLARPRLFGLGLLAGWIGSGIAASIFAEGFRGGPFGYTLLAILVLLVPFTVRARD
jgi:uncharacterized caspase-like protein